ncbi:MAG: AAA family ATPase [Lachnospiraceae bacterium]|nr:AAA family ATPase [Lachnospiraceae bacterium]
MIFKRKASDALKKADIEDRKNVIIVEGGPATGKTVLVSSYAHNTYEGCLYIDVNADAGFISLLKENANKNLSETIYDYFNWDRSEDIYLPVIIDNFDADPLVTEKLYEYINSLRDNQASFRLFITCSHFDMNKLSDEKVKEVLADIILYPMSFEEFLSAIDHEWYAEVIRGHFISRRKIPDMLHSEILDLFEIYLNTGGMPEIIEEYIKLEHISYIRGKKARLNSGIISSALAKADADERFNSVQAMGIMNAVRDTYKKKNRKFMYTSIRRGITEKMYRGCIDYLLDNHYLLAQNRLLTSSEGIQIDSSSLHLYFNDFGLADISSAEITLTEKAGYTAANNYEKKSVIENYILQSFTLNGIRSYYWESGTGAALDFCILSNNRIIPVEIKLPDYKNSVSFSNFVKNNDTKFCIKINLNNYSFTDNQWNIPIYSVGFISGI